MPLTHSFMAINIRNAFILSCFSSAITAVVAVSSKSYFIHLLNKIEKGMNTGLHKLAHTTKLARDEEGEVEGEEHNWKNIIPKKLKYKQLIATLITFLVTFLITFLVYSLLWFTIGFGGSMLTSCVKPSGQAAKCTWS